MQLHCCFASVKLLTCCLLIVQTCHKQYKSAAELDTHLSSYDHHHKKVSLVMHCASSVRIIRLDPFATLTEFSLHLQRLIEMKAMTAVRTKSERDKKEKRRQEKEAAKLQEQ